jgi:hypothetical protein
MNPHHPDTEAARLHALVTAGPRFAMVFPRRSFGRGNCHAIACAIMLDLIDAGQARGWLWCKALCTLATGPGAFVRTEHSFLEFGSFAVDCSSGNVLILDRWTYRSLVRANVHTTRDAKQTLRKVRKLERRMNPNG